MLDGVESLLQRLGGPGKIALRYQGIRLVVADEGAPLGAGAVPGPRGAIRQLVRVLGQLDAPGEVPTVDPEPAQRVEEPGNVGVVADLLGQGQALVESGQRRVIVPRLARGEPVGPEAPEQRQDQAMLPRDPGPVAVQLHALPVLALPALAMPEQIERERLAAWIPRGPRDLEGAQEIGPGGVEPPADRLHVPPNEEAAAQGCRRPAPARAPGARGPPHRGAAAPPAAAFPRASPAGGSVARVASALQCTED